MNAEETQALAEDTVDDILDIVDAINDRHNSRWKRISKLEINYLMSTIGSLCTVLLEYSEAFVLSDKLLAIKDEEVLAQQRIITDLKLKITQQAGEIAFLKKNPTLTPEINVKINQKEEN